MPNKFARVYIDELDIPVLEEDDENEEFVDGVIEFDVSEDVLEDLAKDVLSDSTIKNQ